MTIEDLVSDAMAKLQAAKTLRDGDQSIPGWLDAFREATEAAERSQEVCLVAMKHGLAAAVLYKLSDGNIAPKVSDG